MSISSTRKISSSSPTTSRVNRQYLLTNNYSQYVEDIDTTNNVLVKDENNGERQFQGKSDSNDDQQTNYKSSNPNILNGVEAIAATISPDEQPTTQQQINKVSVYTNNQSIIHDKDVERTGHSYLKHFYEKNEHIIDVDELA